MREAGTVGALWQRRRRRAFTAACGCLAVLAAAGPAAAQEIGYTASLYVARSTYTTDRVTSVYLFNSVDVSAGPLRASVSVPFVRRRISFIDDGAAAAAGLPDGLTTTGFGDPLLRVDVRVRDDRRRSLQIAIAGSVKLPVVDAADGLGTGAADVAVGGSLFKAAGATSLFADVLFWNYGDPEGYDFEDTVSYSVGMGRVLGAGRWSALVSLAGFSRGVDGGTPPVQLNVAVLALAGGRQSVAVTAGLGLTDNSGFSVGTSWRIAR